MTGNIQHIIFDLGNVIVHVHPERAFNGFAHRCKADIQELKKFFLSPLHLEFMKGEIPPTKFYHLLLEKFQCEVPFDEFVSIWKTVIGEPKAGIAELIDGLEGRYTLSLCSNTDLWHWEECRHKCPFFDKFSHFFLSFEMNLIKPDREMFQEVLSRLQAPAEQCVFVDDTLANIEVAREMGFVTIHSDDPVHIREEFRKLRLLP